MAAHCLPTAVRIFAPGPKGYGTTVFDAETGARVPDVRDITIHVPVDDLIMAEITCYVGAFDVKARAEYSFIAPCPECGHGREVT
jgi:hypothetical protein